MHKVKGKIDGHSIKVVSHAISPTRQVHEANIRVEMLVREARVDMLIDPRKYLGAAKEAMKNLCIERYLAFGCEDQASKIKPISLEKMSKRYAAGKLQQIIQ